MMYVDMKGLFISFEGNDGSGKSSVIKAVHQKLNELGYNVILSREPGGSKIAEKIREIILDKDNLGMDDWTEALLYAASRREHINKTIKPALDRGDIILCDRYLDSSLAYQGKARNLGIDNVYNMNQYATNGLLPDLTLLVCVRPEVGLDRIAKNRSDKDRLELETIEFHHNVYDGYQEVAKTYPNRIKIVDGEKSMEEVANDAIEKVVTFVKENYNNDN